MSLIEKIATASSSSVPSSTTATTVSIETYTIIASSVVDDIVVNNKPVDLMKPTEVAKDHYTPKGILLSALIRMKKFGVLLADGTTILKVEPQWTIEKLVFGDGKTQFNEIIDRTMGYLH